MKIGIIVAMEKELQQLRTLLDDGKMEVADGYEYYTGRIGRHDIVMQQGGVGKVNAAVATTTLIHRMAPEMVLSTGVAGGADTALEVMDVVISNACAYHDVWCGKEYAYGQVMGQPARFPSAERPFEIPAGSGFQGRIHTGLIVTGDWFVDSREKMQDILTHFPDAKAVDMESAAIAQTCWRYGIPFLSFRIISDVPLKDTEAAQYYDFWERLANGSFEVTKEFLQQL